MLTCRLLLQIPQHVEDDPDDYEDEEDAPSEDFDEDEEEDIGFHEGMHDVIRLHTATTCRLLHDEELCTLITHCEVQSLRSSSVRLRSR